MNDFLILMEWLIPNLYNGVLNLTYADESLLMVITQERRVNGEWEHRYEVETGVLTIGGYFLMMESDWAYQGQG